MHLLFMTYKLIGPFLLDSACALLSSKQLKVNSIKVCLATSLLGQQHSFGSVYEMAMFDSRQQHV